MGNEAIIKGIHMYYIGIDLGGTKILGAVVDTNFKIIKEKMVLTSREKPWQGVGDDIVKLVKEIVEESNLELSDIKGIGLGFPGPLDKDRDIVIFATNFGWRNVAFSGYVQSKLGIPVKMENDTNAGTLGVKVFGEGKDVSSLIGIFVGTGIGGGMVIGDELWTGHDGIALEVGHMVVDTESENVCACGNKGCWEAVSARLAITRVVDDYIKKEGPDTELARLFDSMENKGKALVEAYRRNIDVVVNAVDKASYYLGVGIGNLINLFNPEMIALGGGIIDDLGEFMLSNIEKTAREYGLNGPAETTKIVHTKLGSDANMLGAAALAMRA